MCLMIDCESDFGVEVGYLNPAGSENEFYKLKQLKFNFHLISVA